ncbi:MAG: PAS domain S-box protein [Deltaproteobacteria bacterium]|nr:PAS domain S-box protein [Deltaproteobacteria bacterium]
MKKDEQKTEAQLIEELEATFNLLEVLNTKTNLRDLMRNVLRFMYGLSGCEAVGIRLRDGNDFPYFETKGFSDEFVELETHLCVDDLDGQVRRDEVGNPILECMCGNIIRGRFDPSMPFFTDRGSFFSNCTTELLASTTEEDRQARTRNRCNGEGYESVFLVPLRMGNETFGLLQFNDRRRDCFSSRFIAQAERLADNVAIALAQRRAEKELLKEKAFSDAALASLPGIFYLFDEQGTFLRWNRNLEIVSGYSGDEIRQMLPEEFFPIDERARINDVVREVFANGQSSVEAGFMSKDGHATAYLFTGVRFELDGVPCLIGMGVDISKRKSLEDERRKLEDQSRQQHKLEAIGTLAGGVAHEINNPISGIMGYARLISDRLDPESPLREFSDGIGMETERVASIVRNLLAFARQEKEYHSPARIIDIVESTLSLVRTIIHRDQITLKVDVPDDLPTIKCRRQQIQQVLLNVLTNARDALNKRYPSYDPNKIIVVTVVPFEKEGRLWIRITIEDHGPGIPDEIRGRLFDPFFTTKDRAKGTGLGLSISHGIVHEHHGELLVECEAGQSTRFHIDLPVDNGWSLEEKAEEPIEAE